MASLPCDRQNDERNKLCRVKSEESLLCRDKPFVKERIVDAVTDNTHRLDKIRPDADRKAVMSHDKDGEPRFSPARNPWSLAETLDSMAALLISKPCKERISLAVRVHEIPGNIEIFLSGNEPAGTSTIERLAKIWKDLGYLSAGFFRPQLLKNFKPTSHCHLPKRMTSKVEEFRLDALKWSFAKIQKRVQSPQHQFLIDTKVPNEKHPLANVQKAVMELQPFFTGKGAECENPPDNDDSYWRRIWKLLATIRSAYKKLIFPKDDEVKPPLDRDTERYIRKANNLLHHLKVMLRAATPTNLAHLFQFDICITVVDDGRNTIFRGPDSAWAWAWVFEHAVRCYNEKMGKGREWLSLVDGWEDSIKALSEQRIDHEELTVHPELKILLHCAKKNGNGAHIFTYIATSKPSCLPCMSFFQGFNFHFGSQFVVYGSDWKIHWSWRFPPDCPNGEAVLRHI